MARRAALELQYGMPGKRSELASDRPRKAQDRPAQKLERVHQVHPVCQEAVLLDVRLGVHAGWPSLCAGHQRRQDGLLHGLPKVCVAVPSADGQRRAHFFRHKPLGELDTGIVPFHVADENLAILPVDHFEKSAALLRAVRNGLLDQNVLSRG